MSHRIEFIDVAKGLCIIMVAFSHSPLERYLPELNAAMGLFRMPLFFFLSGIFLKLSLPPREFIFHKADTLLKPFFVTQFLFFGIAAATGYGVSAWEFMGIFYGNGATIRSTPMWFLTHLWLVLVATYLLLRTNEARLGSNRARAALVLSLVGVGSLAMRLFAPPAGPGAGNVFVLPGLPFSLDILPISMAFFLAGYFLRDKIKRFSPQPLVTAACAAVLCLVAAGTDAAVDLNGRIYTQPVYATLGAGAGIYLMLSVAHFLGRVPILKRPLLAFGVSSLFILIFHSPIGNRAERWFDSLFGLNESLLSAMLAYLVCICLPVLIRRLVYENVWLSRLYLPRRSAVALQRATTR